MPRRSMIDPAKGVLHVEWPLFGELSRGLALKVARAYTPDMVLGVATAGVVPGAVIASMLRCEFHSILISRNYLADVARETPTIFGEIPPRVRGCRVLIVDETCDSGDTLRLAVTAVQNGGATEVKTAVSFKTGAFAPDFHALATESAIVLPWDWEVIVDGAVVKNPIYQEFLA